MPKKNLSLLRRATQRGDRPLTSDGEQASMSVSRPKETKPTKEQTTVDAIGKLYYLRADHDQDWFPTAVAVLKLVFSLRLSSAIWNIISDCDEVFNYWEPLHMFMYGNGLQTWEYSPLYAIRSYFYIYLHMIPGNLFKTFLPSSKVAVFVFLRGFIGLVSMSAEYYLYMGICQRFSNSIGRLFIMFSLIASGMFAASTALLPSTFAMFMNTFAMGAYLREQWFLSILCTCISAFVGWPFAAVLGLPVVLDMLLFRTRQLATRFFIYSLICALAVGGAMIATDSFYYGKFVFAPMNIVLYNVFSPHGPDLYGVEPYTYYVKNLLLNWNIMSPLAIWSLPVAGALYCMLYEAKKEQKTYGFPTAYSYWRRFVPLFTIYLSFMAWLLIFLATPHKEERFLFPIYTLIPLLGAVTVDAIQRIAQKYEYDWSNFVYLVTTVFIVLSLSRGVSQHRNYFAQLDVYKALNDHLVEDPTKLNFDVRNNPLRVCTGKDWHLFPSSFYLPQESLDRAGRKRGVELRFLQSEFKGLLPKYFPNGKLPNVTREIPSEMNDMNREEPSRYVKPDSCDYLVDMEMPTATELEPSYFKQNTIWEPISTHLYLLPRQSHWFYRAFYVPFLSEKHCKYVRYILYRRIVPTVRYND